MTTSKETCERNGKGKVNGRRLGNSMDWWFEWEGGETLREGRGMDIGADTGTGTTECVDNVGVVSEGRGKEEEDKDEDRYQGEGMGPEREGQGGRFHKRKVNTVRC